MGQIYPEANQAKALPGGTPAGWSSGLSWSFTALRRVFLCVCPSSFFLDLLPRGAAGLGTV